MKSSLSPRTRGVLILAAIGMIAALATGRPELALLAAPFLVLAGGGLLLAAASQVGAEIELERPRLLEGESVTATVRLRNEAGRAAHVELGLAYSGQLLVEPSGALGVLVPANGESEVNFSLHPVRWGAHSVGPVLVRVRDPLGLTTYIWPPGVTPPGTYGPTGTVVNEGSDAVLPAVP